MNCEAQRWDRRILFALRHLHPFIRVHSFSTEGSQCLEQELIRAGVESARFRGQVVVMTGAAGGIGGACALRFAQEQARDRLPGYRG